MINIKEKLNTNKITLLGILCALSLISFLIESILPPLFLPGAKLGLSNIFTLMTLIIYSPIEATILLLVRTILGSFIIGNLSSLMYSMPAGLSSILASSLMLYFIHPKVSVVSISILSAVIHNIVQVIMYCIVTQSTALFSYMPYLASIGVLSGVIIGILVYTITHKIPMSVFNKLYSKNKFNILKEEKN